MSGLSCQLCRSAERAAIRFLEHTMPRSSSDVTVFMCREGSRVELYRMHRMLLDCVASAVDLRQMTQTRDGMTRRRENGSARRLGKRLGSVSSLISPVVDSLFREELLPGRVALLTAAANAHALSQRLLDQLELTDIDVPLDPEAVDDYAAERKRESQEWRAGHSAVEAISPAIAEQFAREIATVLFPAGDDCQAVLVREEESTSSGRTWQRLGQHVMLTDPILTHEVVSRAMRRALASLATPIEAVRAPLAKLRASTEKRLAARAPSILKAVDLANGPACGQAIRLYLASARAGRRRVPVQVWLKSAAYDGAVTIELQSPLREFVLENLRGELFYIPPCLIVSRLKATTGGIQGAHGIVRLPAGCTWNYSHPYVGRGLECLSEHTIGQQAEQLPSPSRTATELFGILPIEQANGMTSPRSRDLCLSGRDKQLQQMITSLNWAIDANGLAGADVMGYLLAGLDIVRLGLTNGHQLNTESPRLAMTPDTMPYVLPASAELPDEARSRVFTFDKRPWARGTKPRLVRDNATPF